MNLEKIEHDLIDEVKLTNIEAKIFLLVTLNGKMTPEKIASELGISTELASDSAKKLVLQGGFIEISQNEFEAMHPRFTAVNLYRRMCEREKIEFKKNILVDNIGVALEKYYERARTK